MESEWAAALRDPDDMVQARRVQSEAASMSLDPIGILCALPRELGDLRERAGAARVRQGLEFRDVVLGGVPAVACVGGVGKAYAARAAALLLEEAPRGLLVVGVCGGLARGLEPGKLVHCAEAVQRDAWTFEGHSSRPTASWLDAWRAVAPGSLATFLTADRAVFHPVRAWLATRGRSGPCTADMETAAAAAVAAAAGRPWAALRAVTDRPALFDRSAFGRHYPEQAGRAAGTLERLLPTLPVLD